MIKEYTSVNNVELETKDDMVARSYHLNNKQFEPETFAVFLDIINANKTNMFLDVGAYTGIYSIFAYKHGCHVEAYEPNGKVFRRAVDNLTHNNIKHRQVEIEDAGIRLLSVVGDKMVMHNYGLSDTNTSLDFKTNPKVTLTSGGSFENIRHNTEHNTIVVKRYDDLNRDKIPTIIKIDVEGHELRVLCGMEKLIKEHRPAIIVECNTEKEQNDVTHYLSLFYQFKGIFDGRNLIFV